MQNTNTKYPYPNYPFRIYLPSRIATDYLPIEDPKMTIVNKIK